MGLDLKILITYSERAPDLAHTIIDCARESELFDLFLEVEEKHGFEIESPITSYTGKSEYYDDICYGETYETPYGDVIKGVKSKFLKERLIDYNSVCAKNKAFISYLKELPDDLILYLYWN